MTERAKPPNEWLFEKVESGAYSLGYGNEDDGYEFFPILASDLAGLTGLIGEVQDVITRKGKDPLLERPPNSPVGHLSEIRTVVQAYLKENPHKAEGT